jgi:hypothetical protein
LIDEISPIKRRFQEIYFSHFFNYFLTHSYVFRINPHATFVAPDDDENTHPGIVSHFRKGGKGDLSFYCSVIQTVSQLFCKLFTPIYANIL